MRQIALEMSDAAWLRLARSMYAMGQPRQRGRLTEKEDLEIAEKEERGRLEVLAAMEHINHTVRETDPWTTHKRSETD